MGQQGHAVRLKRIHHVEFWVANGRQASYCYRQAFGFSKLAYAGEETDGRGASSYVLSQGAAVLVFTAALSGAHPAGEHVKVHGDGVRDIVFEVDDVDEVFAATVARGAEPAAEPHTLQDRHGSVRRASIKSFGDTLHSFVSLQGYKGPFLPGFQAAVLSSESVGILAIDHVLVCVEKGHMEEWADWYHRVLDLKLDVPPEERDASTEFTSLRTVVLSNDANSLEILVQEPAEGRRASRVQEFLDSYHGPGVQHIALRTDDAIRTVELLHHRGVDFLRVPDHYYDALPGRVGEIDEDVDTLRDLGLLVDRDDEGYLVQSYTRPIQDRPTFFLEIIERKGSRGHGKGNFKALVESLEAERSQAHAGVP